MTAIDCSDGLGGLTEGPLSVDASGKASRTLSVTGDGQHIVVCGATDNSPAHNTGATDGSNYAAALELDSAPPTVTCSVTPTTIWPPNKKLVPVTATVTVDDAFSGPAGFTLKSVTANEPLDPSDVQGFTPGTASTTGALRADRLGPGSGRIYTLTYQGTDQAGNSATCSATVTVPHNQ
ncbi:hypothetical protein ACFQ9X_26595 [Catenulispora yoronensis]